MLDITMLATQTTIVERASKHQKFKQQKKYKLFTTAFDASINSANKLKKCRKQNFATYLKLSTILLLLIAICAQLNNVNANEFKELDWTEFAQHTQSAANQQRASSPRASSAANFRILMSPQRRKSYELDYPSNATSNAGETTYISLPSNALTNLTNQVSAYNALSASLASLKSRLNSRAAALADQQQATIAPQTPSHAFSGLYATSHAVSGNAPASYIVANQTGLSLATDLSPQGQQSQPQQQHQQQQQQQHHHSQLATYLSAHDSLPTQTTSHESNKTIVLAIPAKINFLTDRSAVRKQQLSSVHSAVDDQYNAAKQLSSLSALAAAAAAASQQHQQQASNQAQQVASASIADINSQANLAAISGEQQSQQGQHQYLIVDDSTSRAGSADVAQLLAAASAQDSSAASSQFTLKYQPTSPAQQLAPASSFQKFYLANSPTGEQTLMTIAQQPQQQQPSENGRDSCVDNCTPSELNSWRKYGISGTKVKYCCSRISTYGKQTDLSSDSLPQIANEEQTNYANIINRLRSRRSKPSSQIQSWQRQARYLPTTATNDDEILSYAREEQQQQQSRKPASKYRSSSNRNKLLHEYEIEASQPASNEPSSQASSDSDANDYGYSQVSPSSSLSSSSSSSSSYNENSQDSPTSSLLKYNSPSSAYESEQPLGGSSGSINEETRDDNYSSERENAYSPLSTQQQQASAAGTNEDLKSSYEKSVDLPTIDGSLSSENSNSAKDDHSVNPNNEYTDSQLNQPQQQNSASKYFSRQARKFSRSNLRQANNSSKQRRRLKDNKRARKFFASKPLNDIVKQQAARANSSLSNNADYDYAQAHYDSPSASNDEVVDIDKAQVANLTKTTMHLRELLTYLEKKVNFQTLSTNETQQQTSATTAAPTVAATVSPQQQQSTTSSSVYSQLYAAASPFSLSNADAALLSSSSLGEFGLKSPYRLDGNSDSLAAYHAATLPQASLLNPAKYYSSGSLGIGGNHPDAAALLAGSPVVVGGPRKRRANKHGSRAHHYANLAGNPLLIAAKPSRLPRYLNSASVANPSVSGAYYSPGGTSPNAAASANYYTSPYAQAPGAIWHPRLASNSALLMPYPYRMLNKAARHYGQTYAALAAAAAANSGASQSSNIGSRESHSPSQATNTVVRQPSSTFYNDESRIHSSALMPGSPAGVAPSLFDGVPISRPMRLRSSSLVLQPQVLPVYSRHSLLASALASEAKA